MSDEKARIYGLRHQVEKYFDRQAQKLIDQARAASFLTPHSGLVGSAGEQNVRSFLRSHLPNRYGVGTGHVVSFRGSSAQVDTVIFDSQDCYTIPITDTETLFSIEGVYAAIEIKSSPSRQYNSKQVLQDAVANISSVKKLTYIPFYMVGIPTFTRISDPYVLSISESVRGYNPICAILMVGTGSTFETAVKNLREEAMSSQYERGIGIPDLLCVLDEENFGLYGCDIEEGNNNERLYKYWRETCTTPGQTLALFLYWLVHKIIFDHVTEQPIVHNTVQKAIWPSVMAPVIPRMHVDVDTDSSQMSWGWKNETRQFENSST